MVTRFVRNVFGLSHVSHLLRLGRLLPRRFYTLFGDQHIKFLLKLFILLLFSVR